jgi:hypothetical protein
VAINKILFSFFPFPLIRSKKVNYPCLSIFLEVNSDNYSTIILGNRGKFLYLKIVQSYYFYLIFYQFVQEKSNKFFAVHPGSIIQGCTMREKIICILIIGLLMTTVTSAIGRTCEKTDPLTWQWAQDAGGLSMDYGYDVETDDSGNSYVVGKYDTMGIFGKTTLTSMGGWDIYVAKLDPEGNWLWAVSAGGILQDEGLGITVDNQGNSYITGIIYDTVWFGNISLTTVGGLDVFIAKLDTYGVWQWAIRAGGWVGEAGYGIDTDHNGNLYVTGHFMWTATFGNTNLTSQGGADVFVGKLDTNGVWQWAVSAGGSQADYVHDIAADTEGNTYITGDFEGTAQFGDTTLTSQGDADIFVAKLDTNGNWLWAYSAGGTFIDRALDVAVNGGTIAITGLYSLTATFGSTTLTSQGSMDIFVATLKIHGNWRWAVNAGGINSDAGWSVALDEAGNSYITGVFEDTATFGTISLTAQGVKDIFVASLNTEGTWRWAIGAGGNNWQEGYALALGAPGNIIITGYFGEQATFGDTTISSQGDFDVFIAKLHEENQPPVADFNITPKDPAAGQTVTFDASSSFDPDGQIVSYKWDFGDHSTGSAMVIEHVYNEPGTYDVTLTVIDDDSATGVLTRQIEVSVGQPPIVFTIKGGIGVTAVITNNGTKDIIDVPWFIRVDGGILGHIQKTKEGMTNVTAGESATVGTGIFFGLGPIKITVRVGSEEKTAAGTQFLMLSLVK